MVEDYGSEYSSSVSLNLLYLYVIFNLIFFVLWNTLGPRSHKAMHISLQFLRLRFQRWMNQKTNGQDEKNN